MIERAKIAGRPSLPKEERRSQRVVTFLTCKESAQVKDIAIREGKSLSQACHDLIQQGLKIS